MAKGHNLACKTFCDLLIVFDIAVDDQCAVFRKKLGKLAEGIADILQILKEIQMIFFNI